MVFLDESGASTQMTRNYGRAPSGKRVAEGTPQSHWHTVTMLAALTTKGLQAPMTIESPTDGDVFLAYLEQVLCPQLHPGQVVILDNLAAHKVAGVQQLIAATGARLLYLRWDRSRARSAVGGGLPLLLFRWQGGFTIPPWRRFPKPPYNAGRPNFSGPV